MMSEEEIVMTNTQEDFKSHLSLIWVLNSWQRQISKLVTSSLMMIKIYLDTLSEQIMTKFRSLMNLDALLM